jgi:hypothetical protein
MLSFKILAAALLAGAALLAAAAFAQGTGRWTIGTLMPSARTEVAVARGRRENLRGRRVRRRARTRSL